MSKGGARPAVVDQPPTRRDELDLLRALVVVGLVFFHTAVIFGTGEFPIKAATENRVATVFIGFGAAWGMPLLFLIGGMGIFYSLGSRSPAAFARERLRRLGVPLLVGLLTLVPLQVWLGLRRGGDPSAYASFYARFWQVRPALDFPFVITAAPGGVFETGHLWFLVCLLGFSLALLPGFAWLRRPAGRRLLERLGGLLARPAGLLLLPALPLAVVEVALSSETGHGGWNHASYALLLVYGFLAAAAPRIGEALQRHWRLAAAVGLVLFLAAGAAAYSAVDAGVEPFTDMEPPAMAFRLLKTVDGWLWVVAIAGLARAHIGRRRGAPQPPAHRTGRASRLRRLGAYANDAVLPFYVLHETVIVAVAYLALAWPIGGGAQYCLIALISLVATLLLYDLGVRRSPLTRFLFGLKQLGRPTPPPVHQIDDSDSSAITGDACYGPSLSSKGARA